MVPIYEELWNDAVAAFERGEPQIDPHLSNKANDLRRGVTLIARSAPSVRDAVAAFMKCLAAVCPAQYFYRPDELHVTVLSIISGTELWRREIRRIPQCQRVIRDVLKAHRPFEIKFQGVTASPAGVMIQGFPADNTLAAIRDELRDAFSRNGLGDMLDRRYKISGAHMTVMRFSEPPMRAHTDLKLLLAILKANRDTMFGQTEVDRLQLIFNDWYASADTVRMLGEYEI